MLVLTTYGTDADSMRAIDAGAVGYLLKDAPHEEIARPVRAAARGETTLAPAIAQRLLQRMRVLARPLPPRSPSWQGVVTAGTRSAWLREYAQAAGQTGQVRGYAALGQADVLHAFGHRVLGAEQELQ